MQKALTEMNVQLTMVLSDLSGLTGMKIIRAIVGGERDGKKLAEFRDPNVKASKEAIANSLEGTWLPEQLAIVGRQLADWDHVQQQMAACDKDLAALLKEMPAAKVKPVEAAAPAAGKTGRRQRKKASKNQPNFDIAGELKRIAGVDLTRIDGIQAMTVQTVISEAGLDMSKWPTEHHFVSWIGLAPRNEISGGKVLKKKTRKVVSRLATALRMAANSLRESQSYLGAQFRRLRSRLGPPKTITAMAAKLARLVYRMLKYGQEYVDKGTAQYEAKYRQQKLKMITKQAADYGLALVPMANPA
jgi:transposase